MRYAVVTHRGEIIAAASLELPPPSEEEPAAEKAAELPEFGLEPAEGQEVVELDLPEEYDSMSPDELLERLSGELHERKTSGA